MTKRSGVALGAIVLFVPLFVSTSCATPDDPVYVGGLESSSGAPELGGADASLPDGPTSSSAMCNTTECPAGRATCPGDRYLCAVDLRRDEFNCGRCGNACPGAGDVELGSLGAKWTCVDGRCAMQCNGYSADCNGIVDDGCEVSIINDKQNCGACGVECISHCAEGHCDCENLGPNATLCGRECVLDIRTDEKNCGACNVRCVETVRLPPSWHAKVGCREGECHRRKCLPNFADCNADLERDDGDGCETGNLSEDPNNCGACGMKCKEGAPCFSGRCYSCRPGEVLCDATQGGALGCFVVDSDRDNCGGCGIACPTSPPGTHGTSTCVGGVCGFTCDSGYADCDGSKANGCETNIRLDSEHCGACGQRCPLTGQACVEGHCVQAPCTSGPTR